MQRIYTNKPAINRLGEVNYNKNGSKMIIDEYNTANDIWVKFLEHGNRIHTAYYLFAKGKVTNVYDIAYSGIGYIGEGKYKIREDGKVTKQYTTWSNMLKRCYDEKFHKRQSTYKDCTVSEEWLCFQNFAEWFDNNYYEIEGERMHLDKDILVKGNKVYSPNACIYVPQSINSIFVKSNAKRGKFPIGVSWSKDKGKFESYYQTKGKRNFLGYFNTPEEAFQKYKNTKEKLIKQTAEDYKEKIPYALYNALINYIVEIDD